MSFPAKQAQAKVELLGGQNVKQEDPTSPDDDLLVPLSERQCAKLKFPPLCPVVLTDSSRSGIPQVSYGSVETAFLRFDTREVVYKLKSQNAEEGFSVVPESALQFGIGAPVWSVPAPGADPVPSVVLNVYVNPEDQERCPLYSVQVLDGWVLHFLSADALTFRAESQPSPPILAPAKRASSEPVALEHKQEEPKVEPETSDMKESVSGDPAGEEPESPQAGRSGSPQTQEEEKHVASPPNNNGGTLSRAYEESEPSAVSATSLARPAEESHSPSASKPKEDPHAKTPPKSSLYTSPAESQVTESLATEKPVVNQDLDTNQQPPPEGHIPRKRSSLLGAPTPQNENATKASPESAHKKVKGEDFDNKTIYRHFLILPIWMEPSAAKAALSLDKIAIEGDCRCKISLGGGAVESDPVKPYKKLYFVVDCIHADYIIAVGRLENSLLMSMKSPGKRCLLMHDIATSNPDLYSKSDRGLVYQRDGLSGSHSWNWMTTVKLPYELSDDVGINLVKGSNMKGVREMRGRSSGRVWVTNSPRPCVYLTAPVKVDTDECRKRVQDRLAWALNWRSSA